ncbi:MAG: hypothetical protein PHH11_13090 [Methylomonas sp.]|nr:hypothetical protein [Methylomonas sp.]
MRLIALSAVASILVCGGVFWLERDRFEAVITERTHLAIELLKLRIQDIEVISHRPWESQVRMIAGLVANNLGLNDRQLHLISV